MDNKTQEQLAGMFSAKFEEYNTLVLTDIADMIKKFKGLNYTEAHKLAQELKFQKSYIDVLDKLAKLTGKSTKEIQEVLEETAKQNLEFADTFYKAKGLETPVYEKSSTLKNMVNAIANVSEGDFSNIARSTGFRLLDNDGNAKYLNMQETYYNVIDNCVLAVAQGTDTFDNVMRNTINQLADSGVRKIEYNNNGKEVYSQRIDTAVRRNILDSIRQISNQTQIEFGNEFGADGVEVTVHSNPAPDHENVQGKQFSMSEYKKLLKTGKATDYKGNLINITTTSKKGKTSHREIGQYNCYHTVFSIILGVSEPLYSDEELEGIKEENNKPINIDGREYTKYEVTQLQRRLETEIRKSKDAHIMFKSTGDNLGMLKEQKRITQLTSKYKEITRKAELPNYLSDRARVSGYKKVSVKELEKIDTNTIKISKERQEQRLKYRKEYLQEEISKNKEGMDFYANQEGNRSESLYKIYKQDYTKLNNEYNRLNKLEIKDKEIKLETASDCQDLLKEVNIDLKDKEINTVNKEVLINNTKKYYEIIEKYPFLEQALQERSLSLEYKKLKEGGVIGLAAKGGRTIELDVYNFDDLERAKYWGEYQTKSGYNMPCSSKDYENYFAVHELGHVFNYRVINNVEFPELGDLGASEFYEKTNMFFKDKIFAIAQKNTGKTAEELELLVSDYGKTNIDEFMAELFANANCGKPNALGKAFEEYFEELLK